VEMSLGGGIFCWFDKRVSQDELKSCPFLILAVCRRVRYDTGGCSDCPSSDIYGPLAPISRAISFPTTSK